MIILLSLLFKKSQILGWNYVIQCWKLSNSPGKTENKEKRGKRGERIKKAPSATKSFPNYPDSSPQASERSTDSPWLLTCNCIPFLFWSSHREGFNCPLLDSLDGHFKETPKRHHLPKQLLCLSKSRQKPKSNLS